MSDRQALGTGVGVRRDPTDRLLTALGNDLFIELNPTKRMSTLSLQIFGNAITGSGPTLFGAYPISTLAI